MVGNTTSWSLAADCSALSRPKPVAAGDDWLEAFVAYAAGECHLAENTVAAYRRDLRHFFLWLERRQHPRAFRSATWPTTWAGCTPAKLAPASIARHIVSLKVFFRYLQLEGVLHDNLAELLGSQKLWERVPKVLSAEQIDRLFAAPDRTDPCWRRDRALLELLYATGCRASELSNLRLRDMHLDEGFCICRGKGDKERMVPLGGRAVAAVRAYLEHERPQAGRPLRHGGRLGSAVLSRAAAAARADLGAVEALCPARRGAAGDQPAHPAAQFRHAPAGRRGRSSPGARDAGPRQHRHHADLHARRSDAAEGGAQEVPPAGVSSLVLAGEGDSPIFADQRFASVPAKIGTVPPTFPHGLFCPRAVFVQLFERFAGGVGPFGLVDLLPQVGQVGQRFGMGGGHGGVEQVDVQEGEQGLFGRGRPADGPCPRCCTLGPGRARRRRRRF